MIRSGYARDVPSGQHHPQAVRWWYVVDGDCETGVEFARGGRCERTHEARQAVYEAALEYKRDLLLREALAGVGLVAR